MKERTEVPVEETWDLTLLFKTEEDYKKSIEYYKQLVENFCKTFENQINTVEAIHQSLADYREILELRGKIVQYASLAVNANTKDRETQNRLAQTRKVVAEYDAKLSFFSPELSQLEKELLAEASKNPENKIYLERLLEDKQHLLSKEVESVLAALGNTLDFPYQNYNDIKFKDIQFPNFEVDGKEFEMTYNSFEKRLESDEDTSVRRKAFEVFSNTLRKYEHSTASAYNAQVQKEKTMATLRGFDSVIDYLLDRQKVSRELYNRQIDLIMEHLAPIMRSYAGLIGKIYQLDEVRYEDLKLEVDPHFAPKVSYEEAKAYILDGLKPLGAFCASPYGANSFILMFFTESMNDVMTLAHELGHAGHFQLAHQHQNIQLSRPSMYFVEAPSTANELLVENYLLQNATDARMKRWIISQIIGKTYYHNFVTHLLEAHYQREVYRLVDEGKNLDAETLNQIYRQTLEHFWGDSVVLTEGAELTWMRQPHYYMGLYSYTYSAGLTIGTQVAKMIQENPNKAEDWVEVLKMGGSKTAEELAKAAGVDVSTDEPLKNTIDTIGEYVKELIYLTNRLD